MTATAALTGLNGSQFKLSSSYGCFRFLFNEDQCVPRFLLHVRAFEDRRTATNDEKEDDEVSDSKYDLDLHDPERRAAQNQPNQLNQLRPRAPLMPPSQSKLRSPRKLIPLLQILRRLKTKLFSSLHC